MGMSVSWLFFIIKKVKMNPKVFRFTKRPCALILVSQSHVNDMEEYSALRVDASRPPKGTLSPPPPPAKKKNNKFLYVLGIYFNGKMILKNQAIED